MDKIGTDNWGERLVLNVFVDNDDCFLTDSTPEPDARTCQETSSQPTPNTPGKTLAYPGHRADIAGKALRNALGTFSATIYTLPAPHGKTKPQARIQRLGTGASAYGTRPNPPRRGLAILQPDRFDRLWGQSQSLFDPCQAFRHSRSGRSIPTVRSRDFWIMVGQQAFEDSCARFQRENLLP